MIITNNRLILSEKYKDIKNKKINEQIVLNIMNDSLIVFKSKYLHSENESSGESDFYDAKNKNNQFDAKLILHSEIRKEMEKNNIQKWFDEIKKEMDEVYLYIQSNCIEKIRTTRLYIEINKRLVNIVEKENAILFFPFPIGLESSKSIIPELMKSSLAYIASFVLADYPKFKEHGNYLIYGTIFNEIVIIDLNTNIMEFLQKDYISKYIKNEIISFKIKN